jgi:hypothetical protein
MEKSLAFVGKKLLENEFICSKCQYFLHLNNIKLAECARMSSAITKSKRPSHLSACS